MRKAGSKVARMEARKVELKELQSEPQMVEDLASKRVEPWAKKWAAMRAGSWEIRMAV